MKFVFNKPECQNIRRALRKEWVLTNGRGDYACGTVPGCNTRKYHGLLVANLASPPGRHVLLSTLEESVEGGGKEFFFSSRQHPGVYYPLGHEYLEFMESGDWPLFRYHIGPLVITREIVLVRGRTIALVRYTVNCPDCIAEDTPPLTLRIKPLLAYRNFHSMAHANMDLQVSTFPVEETSPGFFVRPYNALPPLYMQIDTPNMQFYPAPDWCRNVKYFVEEERGFPAQEDLFLPGVISVPIEPGTSIILSASTEAITEPLEDLWSKETQRRLELCSHDSLQGHLRREASRFLIHAPVFAPKTKTTQKMEQGVPQIIAGYPWFDAWGRDSLIALPGLTFVADRVTQGQEFLEAAGAAMRDGLVPNLFAVGEQPAAYNSADASLWYIWACQQMLEWSPDSAYFFRQKCWPVVKGIIESYRAGTMPDGHGGMLVRTDAEGMLHVGNASTQLTWMDANAFGRPVTPRHGCAVELNSLWYNALAWADELARMYGEDVLTGMEKLRTFRVAFRLRFWEKQRGNHLGDVWWPNAPADGECALGTPIFEQGGGWLDASVRPNQIYAVAVPYSPLDLDDQPSVVESVRDSLLTPYGLRTLSPRNPSYRGNYEGGPDQRDSIYHQGTVWPWMLGAYTDALLKTSWDVENAVADLLATLTPLFTTHLAEAGLGSISEIFDGNPPHRPDGCVAQAWSVAECYRVLRLAENAAPKAYSVWEDRLKNPPKN